MRVVAVVGPVESRGGVVPVWSHLGELGLRSGGSVRAARRGRRPHQGTVGEEEFLEIVIGIPADELAAFCAQFAGH